MTEQLSAQAASDFFYSGVTSAIAKAIFEDREPTITWERACADRHEDVEGVIEDARAVVRWLHRRHKGTDHLLMQKQLIELAGRLPTNSSRKLIKSAVNAIDGLALALVKADRQALFHLTVARSYESDTQLGILDE